MALAGPTQGSKSPQSNNSGQESLLNTLSSVYLLWFNINRVINLQITNKTYHTLLTQEVKNEFTWEHARMNEDCQYSQAEVYGNLTSSWYGQSKKLPSF